MENIKSKIVGVIAIIVFSLLCVVGYRVVFVDSTHYYVKIDSSEPKQLGNNEYEYSLTAHDEHGKMAEMTFKAGKKLREGAYLELDVMLWRGVVNWREIQLDELPLDAKPRLAPSN